MIGSRLLVAIAALALGAPALRAQDADPLAGARLDAPSRMAIARLIDSARAEGLPTEPLVSKALEGSSKGAPPSRIVLVVRTVYRALGDARAALGARATEPDVVAGAAALQAGLAPTALRDLRRARGDRALAMPLVVLADLVTRGVPADPAADAVLRLARGGASDGDFTRLRLDVERDIEGGTAPATAATLRSRAFTPRATVGGDGVPTTRPPAAPEAP